MAVTSQTWSPDSWRERTALQQPEWPDAAVAAAALERLKANPPLVFAGEARELQESLARRARGPRLPGAGRRLRRVLQRAVGDPDPREAEDHAADVRRAHVRRDAAGGEGRPHRWAVHEAALGRVRARRRRRDPEFPGPHGERRRPDRRGAGPGSAEDGRGLQPVRRDAQPAARVHEGRLRRPDAGPHVEQGLRLELTGRAAVRAARVGDRARTCVHGRVRDRPSGRASPARGRLLHQPRGPAARLRGGADAARFAHRRLVRLLGAPPVDRRAHASARRCAHRVLLGRAQPARREDRPRRDARRPRRARRAPEPAAHPGAPHLLRTHGRRAGAGAAAAAAQGDQGGGASGALGLRPDAREHDPHRRRGQDAPLRHDHERARGVLRRVSRGRRLAGRRPSRVHRRGRHRVPGRRRRRARGAALDPATRRSSTRA